MVVRLSVCESSRDRSVYAEMGDGDVLGAVHALVGGGVETGSLSKTLAKVKSLDPRKQRVQKNTWVSQLGVKYLVERTGETILTAWVETQSRLLIVVSNRKVMFFVNSILSLREKPDFTTTDGQRPTFVKSANHSALHYLH